VVKFPGTGAGPPNRLERVAGWGEYPHQGALIVGDENVPVPVHRKVGGLSEHGPVLRRSGRGNGFRFQFALERERLIELQPAPGIRRPTAGEKNPSDDSAEEERDIFSKQD